MINIAIIEDEQKSLEALKRGFALYESETGESFRLFHFNDAELFLTNYKPRYDIVFMDIMLPGMDGLEAARRLRRFDENVALIFTTTMAQFAIKGYSVNAIDYFVKPYTYFDLKMRLDKIIKKLKEKEVFIPIPIPGGNKSVSAYDLMYIESNGHQITYHTLTETVSTFGKTIKELANMLENANFASCNQCYLVNLRHCKEINGDEVIVGNDVLKISRGKRNEFLEKLSKFLHNGGN